ncbi:MAG: LacI family DNA-binding transcriptional regulator [Brevirhabdus sp.]
MSFAVMRKPTGETGSGTRRTTIQDVADALGMSKGTVSRALNNYTDISEQTRLRVKRMAESMGYRPMAQAQAIRTGRARSIGLVLSVDEDNAQKPFLTDFLDGVCQAASAEHWTLTVATATSEQDGVDTMRRLIEERKADGFILPRTKTDDRRIDLCRSASVPFVLYGRTGDPSGCAWYDVRGEDAIRDAVVRLARQGHTRIAFINGGVSYHYAPLRLEGYRAGMASVGLNIDRALIREGATTAEAGEKAALEVLRLDTPPTAIVCALDAAALGVFAAIKRVGLDIGTDISVIAYDGIPEGGYSSPGLTTFAVDTRAAGRRLAEMLMARIRGTAPEALRELASATLLVRGSDGPPRKSPETLARNIRAIEPTKEEIQ